MNDDHPLQFQLPACVYNFAPTLVPGGGAEVVPPTNLEWFANNGFHFSPDNHFLQDNHQQAPPAEQYESSSPPFNFADSDVSFPPPSPVLQPDLSLLSSLTAPSPYGLPVYSVSGFDIVSILSRVHHRPNPTVHLGPVDLTASFVVSDARRYDDPIVYCSPNFCTLTGYTEPEIIGRNCRFLQAPGGQVAKGEPRRFTSQDSANLIRKSLIAGKDCQTSIVNYKKDGSAFINLVTVITLHGDDKEPLYYVGFQVDLTEQPNAILAKLQNGTYMSNFEPRSDVLSSTQNNPQSANAKGKINSIPPLVISKDLKRLLDDPSFLRSFPVPTSSAVTDESVSDGSNQLLHLFLLEASPDFIHVVSLKGNFLYVAPSVRRVLGYDSEEMIGSSIADYAHPEDVVPLMRELKESSATGVTASSSNTNDAPTALPTMPRSVDLLFRAKTKMGRYVWVECRGRLYVEPGKGRKAIILSGRAREMMSLKWEDVNLAGGLAKSIRQGRGKESKEIGQEVWGTLGGMGKETATFMSVGQGMQEVLGWTSEELVGTALVDIIQDDFVKNAVGGFVQSMRDCQQRRFVPAHRRVHLDGARHRKIRCRLRKRDGSLADVWLILYRADLDDLGDEVQLHSMQDKRGMGMSISPASLVFQIRLFEAETDLCGPNSLPLPSVPVPSPSTIGGGDQHAPTSSSLDLFEELSIARGSSWQYELQQLRFANARLEEELAVLETAVEVAEARKTASSTSTTSNPNSTESGNAADRLEATNSQGKYEQHEPLTFSGSSGFHRQLPPPPPPPSLPHQDLFSRGQLVVPEHAYVHGTGAGGVYESMGIHIQPFLYHPKPQYSPQGLVVSPSPDQQQQQQQQQNDRGINTSMNRHHSQVLHQHQPSHRPSQTWGTMPSPSSLSPKPPPAPTLGQGYARHRPPPQSMGATTTSSGHKRSWSAIDSA